jgi:hypothetical protein
MCQEWVSWLFDHPILTPLNKISLTILGQGALSEMLYWCDEHIHAYIYIHYKRTHTRIHTKPFAWIIISEANILGIRLILHYQRVNYNQILKRLSQRLRLGVLFTLYYHSAYRCNICATVQVSCISVTLAICHRKTRKQTWTGFFLKKTYSWKDLAESG